VTVRVVINGQARELSAGATLAELVASMPGAPDGRGVAVALDGEVVPRGAWQRTVLTDRARVEVVAAVQGG
jgi:sulfur carrier protein